MDERGRDDLRPVEHDLVGQWLDTGNRIVGDGVCERIEWLVAHRLRRVSSTAHSDAALYRDPSDGRLWELTHPYPEWPRGGPPRLTAITREEAVKRYGGLDDEPRVAE
ncbi:MAG TPA: Imm27 family immunity protein [Gemmatimonadaceae bacterium]|nr:Imm27 family immunity protein [Gemmatimonadaceae bacterium]